MLEGDRMHPFILFFIRAVLGVAIATLITRMFRGEISTPYVAGLAAVLVGLAYVLEYFRKRGFKDETIRTFGLGYAPNSWDALMKHAAEVGLPPDVLEQAGLGAH